MVILCVVAPLLHSIPLATDEVSITLPPGQNVSGPFADIVGIRGVIRFTIVAAEVPPQVPVLVTL